MALYRLIDNAGDHYEGQGKNRREYHGGECVESDLDLIAVFPGKFEPAPEGSVDKYAQAPEPAPEPKATKPKVKKVKVKTGG